MYPLPATFSLFLSLFKWMSSFGFAWFLLEPVCLFFYQGVFVPLLIFLAIYVGVVQNRQVHHFLRFNASLAIIVEVVI
jgi:uncharacterized membrane protein